MEPTSKFNTSESSTVKYGKGGRTTLLVFTYCSPTENGGVFFLSISSEEHTF